MKKSILFTLVVWISHSFTAAYAEIPKDSCIVSPEDTKASILGIVEYKKDSYAQYEKSIQEQIRNFKVEFSKKNIEIDFSKDECLENALLSLNNLKDLVEQEKIEPSPKKRIIQIGQESSSPHENILFIGEVSIQTQSRITRFLKD